MNLTEQGNQVGGLVKRKWKEKLCKLYFNFKKLQKNLNSSKAVGKAGEQLWETHRQEQACIPSLTQMAATVMGDAFQPKMSLAS